MRLPRSATRASSAGRMPRTRPAAPRLPAESIACASTNGAAASTCGCAAASCATARQSARRPPAPSSCTCEATPRMRVRTSFCRPFITDMMTISAHTPSAMPIIDTAELTPTKRLRRCARV